MSDNRIISANDVILPDDIVNYINSNIKKNWTGISASWKASKAHIKSFNDKDFSRMEESYPIIKDAYGEKGWDIDIKFNHACKEITFRVTKL